MVSVVQSKQSTASTSPISVLFDNNLVSGNLIAVVAGEYNSVNAAPETPTISGSQSNTWTLLGSSSQNVPTESVSTYIWYTIAKSGAETVTVTFTGTPFNNLGVSIHELNGVGDGTNFSAASSGVGSSTSMTCASTSFPNSSILIAGYITDNAGSSLSGGTNYTKTGTDTGYSAEYSTTDTSPTTFPMTTSTGIWAGVGAWFSANSLAAVKFFESGSKRLYRRGNFRR